jgi:hypothetical protein
MDDGQLWTIGKLLFRLAEKPHLADFRCEDRQLHLGISMLDLIMRTRLLS